MKNRVSIFLILICGTFSSCKHDTVNPTCQQQTNSLSSFLKQFEFKLGSYWIYTSPNSTHIDTIKVASFQNDLWNYPYCTPNSSSMGLNNCVNNNDMCVKYEDCHVVLSNRSFDGGNSLGMDINGNYIFLLVAGSNYNQSRPRLLVTNLNDSLRNSNYFSKLELKHDTLTVSGVKYNNVYQMFCSFPYVKFQRLWWCASIGFVKFEYINPQNQIETWYLSNYHVVL